VGGWHGARRSLAGLWWTKAGRRRRDQETFPEACRCLADDAEASLNHLKVPTWHRQYVRTSNLAERAFEEERRRTRVIPHLWDEASLVKRVFAVLMRVSERWGKKQYSGLSSTKFGPYAIRWASTSNLRRHRW